jgi:hypothetical protein
MKQEASESAWGFASHLSKALSLSIAHFQVENSFKLNTFFESNLDGFKSGAD